MSDSEAGGNAGSTAARDGELSRLFSQLSMKIDSLQESSKNAAEESEKAQRKLLDRIENLETKADFDKVLPMPPLLSTSSQEPKMSLPESSMRVPKLGSRSDFRDALTDLCNWHEIVTQPGYRNSISTSEAIRQFIAENPVEAGQNPNLEVFRRSVYKQILNSSISTSGSSGRDDRLFREFTTIWKTFLLPSEMKEKLDAYSAVFGSSRKSGPLSCLQWNSFVKMLQSCVSCLMVMAMRVCTRLFPFLYSI